MTADTTIIEPAGQATPLAAEPFAVALIDNLVPWRGFLAGEVLLECHKRGCCENVLASLAEIERRHHENPTGCELRVVTARREVPAGDLFLSVLAALVTDTGRDDQGRDFLKLWYGWARPGFGGAALRWGAERLEGIARDKDCTVLQGWSSRGDAAYGRWIEHNLGMTPVNVRMYRKILPD
jgi:hypothetical protein